MHAKLILALAAAAVFCALACSQTYAYEGPKWALGGSYVETVTTIKSSGELTLEDSKMGLKVACRFTGEAKVNHEGKGEITSLSMTSCKALKTCEAAEPSLKTAKTPWSTQLEEPQIEGANPELRNKISSLELSLECLLFGAKVKDECKFETTTGETQDIATGAEQLFNGKSAHGNCSIGGVGTGVLTGVDLDENKEGKKLAVVYFMRALLTTSGIPSMPPNVCLFTLMNESCTVELENISNVPITIVLKELKGTNANTRYGLPNPNCRVNVQLAAAGPGGGGGKCTDTVRTLETPTPSWSNDLTYNTTNGTSTYTVQAFLMPN